MIEYDTWRDIRAAAGKAIRCSQISERTVRRYAARRDGDPLRLAVGSRGNGVVFVTGDEIARWSKVWLGDPGSRKPLQRGDLRRRTPARQRRATA